MKTIIVTITRYVNNMDTEFDVIYRGIGWGVNKDIKDWCVLDIYGQNGVIATYKQWQSIRFADEAEERVL